MQRATAGGRRFRRAAGRKWPPAAVGATLILGSAIAFALDGPVARVAYQKGLDPATFGFWRASAGVLVLGGWLATRLRPGALAAIGQMRRAAANRLALAAVAGLGLNLTLFEAFAQLPVAVAVAAFGCYPLFVAACSGQRGRSAAVPGRPAAHRSHPDGGAVAVRTPHRDAARRRHAPPAAGTHAAAGGRAAGGRRHRRADTARPPGPHGGREDESARPVRQSYRQGQNQTSLTRRGGFRRSSTVRIKT
jgi:EamA-like transporter family